jgi:hypothetical protein
MTEAWGEGGDDGDGMPSSIDIGNGLRLRIDPARFRRMMTSPPVQAAVDARGEKIAAEATAEAIVEGAAYQYVPSSNPHNSRARGIVRSANFQAVVDEHAHATLTKAAVANNDPKPETDSA